MIEILSGSPESRSEEEINLLVACLGHFSTIQTTRNIDPVKSYQSEKKTASLFTLTSRKKGYCISPESLTKNVYLQLSGSSVLLDAIEANTRNKDSRILNKLDDFIPDNSDNGILGSEGLGNIA